MPKHAGRAGGSRDKVEDGKPADGEPRPKDGAKGQQDARPSRQAPVRREAIEAVARAGWERADDDSSASAAQRKASQKKPRKRGPRVKVDTSELTAAVGERRAGRLAKLLTNGAEAYSAERYEEARKALRIVAGEAPSAASVRELYGLTLYRLGRWAAAVDELEAFRSMTGSTEQNPVLADCYRALRRYADVDEVWRELREASPSADLVTEGRIVAAGALADRGELAEALELLGRRFEPPARAQEHHVRRAYALADLYERAGDLPHARRLFQRVQGFDPDYADVADRLASLG